MSEPEVKDIQDRFEGMFQQGVMPWTEHELELPIKNLPERLLANNPQPLLLDIGCGNGWVSLYLASRGIHVRGIDSSPTAIAQAQQLAQQSQLSEMAVFEVGDGLHLPYESESFDAVLDRGFFHHVPEDEYERYIAEVTRVLQDKGLLSIHTFTTRNKGVGRHHFTLEDINRIFGNYFELLEHSEDKWPIQAPAHLGHYLLQKK